MGGIKTRETASITLGHLGHMGAKGEFFDMCITYWPGAAIDEGATDQIAISITPANPKTDNDRFETIVDLSSAEARMLHHALSLMLAMMR